MRLSIQPQVFSAAMDSGFLRALGICALGFLPVKNTEVMLHENEYENEYENDKYLPVRIFTRNLGVHWIAGKAGLARQRNGGKGNKDKWRIALVWYGHVELL